MISLFRTESETTESPKVSNTISESRRELMVGELFLGEASTELTELIPKRIIGQNDNVW